MADGTSLGNDAFIDDTHLCMYKPIDNVIILVVPNNDLQVIHEEKNVLIWCILMCMRRI